MTCAIDINDPIFIIFITEEILATLEEVYINVSLVKILFFYFSLFSFFFI